MTDYGQTKQKRRRVATIALLCEIVVLICLTIRYLRVGFEVVGAYAGIALGVPMGIFYITIWFRSVKKGIFVVQCQAGWKFMVWFFVMVLIFAIFAVVLGQIAHRYPDIDPAHLFGTALLVFMAVFNTIATAGIYWLEWRSGKKLYLARLNK